MGRPRRSVSEPVGDDLRAVLNARWMVCVVAGYMHRHEDTPCGRALRALSREHKRRLPDALDAYREALGVLEAHGALEDFETWRKDRRQWRAGDWPTRDREEDRERMRPLIEAQLRKNGEVV